MKEKPIRNFYAGPGKIPKHVIQKMNSEFNNYRGLGMSVMEISHRASPILELIERTSEKIRNMLTLDANHSVIFLQGGGSLQFHMVPMNLSGTNDPVDYIDTGYWADKAINAAKSLGRDIHLAGQAYTSIPKDLDIRDHTRYLHLCSNNTVMGTQWKDFPYTNIPIVADMSSDLLSKKINANKFDIIYAHGQKTIGASGVTVVIVSNSLLEERSYDIPDFFSYRTHVAAKSNYHTPPVFAIYTIECMLDWLNNEIGGIETMEKINHEKASKLYQWLDHSELFSCPVEIHSRSLMNVIFDPIDQKVGKRFSAAAEQEGFLGLEGHRTRGGFRASLYNAVSLEDVNELIEFMRSFENNYS